jgi:hypothetical protein
MGMESHGGMILTGENRGTRRQTCPSATLSTTNPTWIEPGANPGLRGERPVTNRLTWLLTAGERRWERKGNNLPASNNWNAWSYTSIFPYVSAAWLAGATLPLGRFQLRRFMLRQGTGPECSCE